MVSSSPLFGCGLPPKKRIVASSGIPHLRRIAILVEAAGSNWLRIGTLRK